MHIKTIDQIQKDIVQTFQTIKNDRIATIEYIIDIGNELSPIEEKDKTENNAIEGCVSKVWVTHKIENNRLQLKGDSNTSVVKGILSLIIKIFNNQKPQDIVTAQLFFIEETELHNLITSQRFIGVDHIIKHIKSIAKQNLQTTSTHKITTTE
jgi:cysteine desulfuration protein SufE